MDQLNQLNEKNLYRQKGKAGIGYKEEGESSKQGAQKNKKPTCSHYGKRGNTSNKCWNNGKEKFNGKCYNCNHHKLGKCIMVLVDLAKICVKVWYLCKGHLANSSVLSCSCDVKKLYVTFCERDICEVL